MTIDLNADMGSIFKNLMGKNGYSKAGSGLSIDAYKTALAILILTICAIALYINFVYIPMKEANEKKTEELNKIIEMKSQLTVLDGQISMLQKKLDKSKEQYIESLSHFGNSEDLGDLYQTVSALATKYNLVVLNVKELAPPPEPKAANPAAPAPAPGAAPTAAEAPKKAKIDVKEIIVELEVKGRYSDYMKFKEDLAIAEIFLKVNTESVMVKNETTEQGSIYVKLNLSTYAIDKKPFQGIVSENTEEKTTDKTNEKTK